MIKKGYYRHYKGGLYQVINIGKHTETEDELVVYRDVKDQIWLRPVSVWNDKVEGVIRFEFFKDQRDGWLKFELSRKAFLNKQ